VPAQKQKGELVMKKTVLVMLSMFVLLFASAAFADDERGTATGKLEMLRQHGVVLINTKSGVVYNFSLDLERATKAFRECIDDGSYAGLVKVTALIDTKTPTDVGLFLDESATCERVSP
jgi:hypothetical protein